jgi:MTH538 TIR-like domain (DUF1863)
MMALTGAEPMKSAESADRTYRFDAFISYCRSGVDRVVAQRLQRVLEGYTAPKGIGTGGKRLGVERIFRDDTELAAAADLAATLKSELRASRVLIVICSPRTPKSRWVCEEVEHFCALGRRRHVFVVLIEGDESLSFPPILRSGPEPLYIDLRAESRRQQIKKLKRERLRLAAAILECRYDDLRQREQERKFRRRAVSTIVICGLVVVFAALLYQWVSANYREKVTKEVAKSNMNLALDSANRLLPLVLLEDDDRQRKIVYLSNTAKDLETMLRQDPSNIHTMVNLRGVYASMAEIMKDQPPRAQQAMAKAVALRIPLALARLEAWDPRIQPDTTPDTLESIGKEMALAEQLKTRTPDNAVRYLDTAIEFATVLDTTTRAGRSEARRILEKGARWLKESAPAEGFTGEHSRLFAALRQKLQALSE